MLDNMLNPSVLFFVFGLFAGLVKSDLKLPPALYESLSIYLLLAIGLKGGIQLSNADMAEAALPVFMTLLLGVCIPCLAYFILRKTGRFARSDSAAIAAHYGSTSAVTYAVCLSYLQNQAISYEQFTTLLLVILEVPAIVVGILIAKARAEGIKLDWGTLLPEILLGKSILLLLGGLLIGWVAGEQRMRPLDQVFVDLFHGALAFFLLEMGLVTSKRFDALKKTGVFLILFGISMPVVSGLLGCIAGMLCGLSAGGTAVLATLAASASYIAAPAAVRIAIPEANPTLYLTASLGITFPFNILFGIPLYVGLAEVSQLF
jgi:hypothetical protein